MSLGRLILPSFWRRRSRFLTKNKAVSLMATKMSNPQRIKNSSTAPNPLPVSDIGSVLLKL